MGNALAASAPPPPPPPPPGPGLMPNLGKPDPSTDVYAPTEAPSQVENPGTIEDLHKKCKGTSSELVPRPSCTPPLSLRTLRVFPFYHRKLPSRLLPHRSTINHRHYHFFSIRTSSHIMPIIFIIFSPNFYIVLPDRLFRHLVSKSMMCDVKFYILVCVM